MATILIVDDQAKHREFLANFLGQQGYDLREAANGLEALARMQAERIHLVITDALLPQMNGFELVRQVRRDPTLAPTPVIFYTDSFHDAQAQTLAQGCGILRFIPKPADPEEIFRVVDAALHLPPQPSPIVVPEEFERDHLRLLTNKVSQYHKEKQLLGELVEVRNNQIEDLKATASKMCEELNRSYRAILHVLTTALEARDVETHEHSQRVVAYSLRLGQQLGLSDREMIALEHGALLHDIGKIVIPDAILLKPGPLSEKEQEIMRSHVECGAELLHGIEVLQDALPVITQHHEKWDGSGYPRGLKREQISIYARIFAVADAVDAITSDRPYQPRKSFEVAAEAIAMGAGNHFDPQVAEAFLSVPLNEWRQLCESRNADSPEEQSSRPGATGALHLSSPSLSWIERATSVITTLNGLPRPPVLLPQPSQALAQN